MTRLADASAETSSSAASRESRPVKVSAAPVRARRIRSPPSPGTA